MDYSVICSGYTINADKFQSEWTQSLKTSVIHSNAGMQQTKNYKPVKF